MSSKPHTAEIIKLPVKHRIETIHIVRQVKGAVDQKVTYLFEGLMTNVVDALFEEIDSADEKGDLTSHFNITRALKTEAMPYTEEFLILMNLSWVNLIKGKDTQPVKDPDDEICFLLKEFSDRNLNHYKILLEELRQRFCVVAGRELDYHPLLPGNFYLCYWHATEKLKLSPVERKLLLPLFNRFVMDRFGQVLSIANQSMVDIGIKIPKSLVHS
ncbi:MAG: hypothetical protein ACI9FB_002234 [Candidatus Azotimanducaceae bacterium]|jgi:hypothetical protein